MKRLLSDVLDPQLQEVPLMFIKSFSKQEFKNQFNEGEIFINTFDFFVKEEAANGIGRGDAYEGINVMSNVHLKFYKNNTSDLIMEAFAGEDGVKSKINETEKMHLLSMTAVFPNWFEIINTNEDEKTETFTCRLIIPDDFKVSMGEDFGNTIALFNAGDFINQLEVYGKQNNTNILHGKVNYLDFKSNPQERISAFVENKPDFFFQKRLEFGIQQEYRFVFPDIISSKGEKIILPNRINLIEDINSISDIKEYEFGLTISFKK